jgi:hypothetical protein
MHNIKCLWNANGFLSCQKKNIETFIQLPNDNMQSDNGTRSLKPGDSFTSFYKNYTVTYKKDGNLVVYPNVWTTSQENENPRSMIVKKNGEFELQDANGNRLTSVSKYGDQNPKNGTRYDTLFGSEIWSSQSPNPKPGEAIIQNDGNFTLRDANNSQYWATDTYGKGQGPYRMLIQENKDLVLYDKNNTIIWNSFSHPVKEIKEIK